MERLITRRGFNFSLICGTTAGLACQGQRATMIQEVLAMETRENLGIVCPRNDGGKGFSADQRALGGLKLKGAAQFPPAVSPDGRWIAWFPERTQSTPPPGFVQQVIFSDGGSSKRTEVVGWPGAALAVSSGATAFALAILQPQMPSLIVVQTEKRTEQRLSHLVVNFGVREIDRLGLSGNGGRLLVGSRQAFYVLDVLSKKPLIYREGRFPSLSQDGLYVAFVDSGSSLKVKTLSSGAERPLPTGGPINFSCSWSPNGRYLLAGGEQVLGGSRLIIIDTVKGAFVVQSEFEGESADRYCWVKRGLLSAS